MGTKTIKTNVTLHVPGTRHVPFEIDASGNHLRGNYAVREIPPGTEVELNEDEADAILARHGGEVVDKKAETPRAAPAPRPATQGGQAAGQ